MVRSATWGADERIDERSGHPFGTARASRSRRARARLGRRARVSGRRTRFGGARCRASPRYARDGSRVEGRARERRPGRRGSHSRLSLALASHPGGRRAPSGAPRLPRDAVRTRVDRPRDRGRARVGLRGGPLVLQPRPRARRPHAVPAPRGSQGSAHLVGAGRATHPGDRPLVARAASARRGGRRRAGGDAGRELAGDRALRPGLSRDRHAERARAGERAALADSADPRAREARRAAARRRFGP